MSSSLTAIAIVIVNSHSQLNIVFRISNAYTQCGQITNLTEQVLVFPQISHIDAESVLFYLFNLGNLWFPCIGILNYVQNDTKPHGLFL